MNNRAFEGFSEGSPHEKVVLCTFFSFIDFRRIIYSGPYDLRMQSAV